MAIGFVYAEIVFQIQLVIADGAIGRTGVVGQYLVATGTPNSLPFYRRKRYNGGIRYPVAVRIY